MPVPEVAERTSLARSLDTMRAMGERGFAHRVDIVGSVPSVWRAFTEVTHLTRWCAPDARIRACAGGLFRGSVDRVTEIEAHIDVYDLQRRMRLIYLPSPALPSADTAVVVDFILEPATRGAILRVLGYGIPDSVEWETQYKRMRVGWSSALTRLKVYVETQMAEGAATGEADRTTQPSVRTRRTEEQK